jgi:hypothetical protein
MSGHPHPSASISEIGKEIAFGRLAESLLKFPPPFLSLEMGVQVFFITKYSTTQKKSGGWKNEIPKWNLFKE